jgi:hypothetical protein
MEYQVTLIDRVEREARVKKGVDSSTETFTFYEFRNKATELKVIRIANDIPIYRVENYRTYSDQLNYVSREHKSADFFQTGQENESVQQIQHEILAKLAEKGKSSSVVPIIEVLEREGQREHLLITSSGVVVNGNRRLAGMRELFAKDPQTFSNFSHVNCMVLPADATANEILEIEGKLQGRPETRLDYDWIGDAQLVSALLRVKNGKPEEIAKILTRKTSEVKNVLQALAEADMYIKDWAINKSDYGRISEHGEQFFKDLPGELLRKSVPLQDASRAIAWTLFENSSKLPGRLYNYNIVFGDRADDVLDQLAERLGVSLSPVTTAGEGDFDFDSGDDSDQVSYQPLIDILKDPVKKAEAIEGLIEISVSVVESEKDKKSGGAALKAITVANAKLAEVDLTRADSETYDSLKRQLDSVIQRATHLQDQLSKLKSSTPGGGVSA